MAGECSMDERLPSLRVTPSRQIFVQETLSLVTYREVREDSD
jgi:hypothetical protein